MLLVAVVATVALQLALIYSPFLNEIFKTQPLEWAELAVCAALAVVIFIAVELEKWVVRRFGLYRVATPAARGIQE